MTKVGSNPAAPNTAAKSEVVVVLPCVPQTATPFLNRINSPNISARATSGMPAAFAAAHSGLSAATAAENTTQSAPSILAAACPRAIGAPSRARRVNAADSDAGVISEPLTANPRLQKISASPLMPAPPMPTK